MLPRQLWKELTRLHNKQFSPPWIRDCPEGCALGPRYWKNYFITDYDYKFNSWGYRAEDYDQYLGKKVNICVGDSFAMNIGGPIEHSFPTELQKQFNIPTLNLGICKADYEWMAVGLERAREMFDVQHIFVLCNLFGDEERLKQDTSGIKEYIHQDLDKKLNMFRKNYQEAGAHYLFVPPWTFREEELKLLYEYFPDAHDYTKNLTFSYSEIDINMLLNIDYLMMSYAEIAGHDWIPYTKFCEIYCSGRDVTEHFKGADKLQVTEYLTHFNREVKQMLMTNRDGWHFSHKVNKSLAKAFYNKLNRIIT